MRIVIGRSNMAAVGRFKELADMLASGKARTELQRGVTDAGRKVKTKVQKAVTKQMALLPGNYNSYVVAGTRGIPRAGILAFDIFGVKGGTHIEKYKGLRAVKSGSSLNKGRKGLERGTVRSAVWNNPRIFKRSFATAGGFYAVRPASAGTSKVAPKILWTYGLKTGQPRGAGGKFVAQDKTYGKIRTLYGPSLMMEIPEDLSLATFMREGPPLLEQAVMKRVEKLMRF
jgi:hypothetical protein